MSRSIGWTPERRERQRAAIAVWKPWERSTGPKTAEGKARSSRNADRGGLAQYKGAIERLDASGTEALFTPEAQIFETGKPEGTYLNYLAHHLGPELDHFRSFKFSDYKVDVRFEGPLALATETYRYRIEPKTGEPAERLGVATSVLKKVDGRWRIISMHNSARKPRPS